MKKTISVVLSASLVVAATGAVTAWGQTGHRVSAKMAENYLTPAAKKAVTDLLGVETMAQAATWPDEMRSHPSEFWQKTSSSWHYVTVPEGKTYAEVGAPEKGDAVTALKKFTATLKDDSASQKDKQLALRFIIHIIGDLHQPLHAGNGTDRGGNDEKVKFFWQDKNLHTVWDTSMIQGENLSFSEWSTWLSNKTTAAEVKQWSVVDPKVWIAESIELRDALYPKDPNINYDYKFKHLPTIKQRLRMASVRIAAYLNATFK